MIRLYCRRTGPGLKAYIRQVDEASAQTPARLAGQVARDWAAAVPVDTGALRASIYTRTRAADGYGMAVAGALARRPHAPIAPPPGALSRPNSAQVGSAVAYSLYVEYGTSRMPARPAFEPAVAAARRAAPVVVGKGLKVHP